MKVLDFPELRQTYEYDCGAKSLQAVLTYYGIELREELIISCAKTNSKIGTSTEGMIHTLEKYGLKFYVREMCVEELKDYIDGRMPILILLQAWHGTKVNYSHDYQDGHWVVAIGYDKDKIFFEDPYTFERAYLTERELCLRWHAREGGEKIKHPGIAVYGKKPVYNSKKLIHMK